MRVFWKRPERETLGGWPETLDSFDPLEELAARPLTETVQIECGALRAAAICRIAEELRRRGEEVVEIFETINSPVGQAVLPIHLRRGGEDIFVEVETGTWERRTVGDVLKTVAVLRGSEYSDAVCEVLGAYPVPEEVRYFCRQTPAAIFQLALIHRCESGEAGVCAGVFKKTAERHWDLTLDYDLDELPMIEELLLATLGKGPNGDGDVGTAPVLTALVRGYGCYAGEILRRRAASRGSWCPATDWGEDLLVEFPNAAADPIGKARAFFKKGPEDSVAYYVAYALEELNG